MAEATVLQADREEAARCWTDPRVSDRVMDPELAGVFAEVLAEKRTRIERLESQLEDVPDVGPYLS